VVHPQHIWSRLSFFFSSLFFQLNADAPSPLPEKETIGKGGHLKIYIYMDAPCVFLVGFCTDSPDFFPVVPLVLRATVLGSRDRNARFGFPPVFGLGGRHERTKWRVR
jgi:hypothetical protein